MEETITKEEEEKRKEFEEFFEEQMRIFKGHTDRINLRLVNKYTELFFPVREGLGR